MKLILITLLTVFMAVTFSYAQHRVRYSGSRHTYSHGGHYAGGHGTDIIAIEVLIITTADIEDKR